MNRKLEILLVPKSSKPSTIDAKGLGIDMNILKMFELVQTTVILVALLAGFCVLLYTLLDRRRKTVWGLWWALLCGFIQVCYCAASVFAARHLRKEPVSIQCSDIYTIPMLCDILTMTVLVISAFAVHFSNTKAAILKHIIFIYILICSVFVVALQSWTNYYKSASIMLTPNIELQTTSCCTDPNEAMLVVVWEYLLIFLPLAAVLLFIYLRLKKKKDNRQGLQFFFTCTNENVCATCQHQNMVCKTVLFAICLGIYLIRPIIIVLSSVYKILNQDLAPSMISTAIYVYLCFEYCIILQNGCKQNKETQTTDPEDNMKKPDVVVLVESASDAC